MTNKQRLDKFLATVGLTVRSQVKQVLKTHIITVNGEEATNPSQRIDPEKDILTYDGETISYQKNVYFMLNKPANVISTTSDELARETVVALIDTHRKIFPIGRLDKDTRGLILLTTDGELTHKLIHPKFHVPKIYHLTIKPPLSETQIQAFHKGVILDKKLTRPAIAEIINQTDNEIILEVTLHEGRFRQIRRTCEILNIELLDLNRVQFGPIKLGKLEEGEYRELTEKEVKQLQNCINS